LSFRFFDADEEQRDRAVSDASLESVTRVSPSRRVLGSKEMRQLMEGLSAQQASLARSVALMDKDYLSHSYYLDPNRARARAQRAHRFRHQLGRRSAGVHSRHE